MTVNFIMTLTRVIFALLLVSLSLTQSTAAQTHARNDLQLPCAPRILAQSALGKYLWFSCSAASRHGDSTQTIYVLELASGKSSKVLEGALVISIVPVPNSDLVCITRYPESNRLYLGLSDMGDLNAGYITPRWSRDGMTAYGFEARGLQSEGFNILTIIDRLSGSTRKVHLAGIFEVLEVCWDSGELVVAYLSVERGRGKVKGLRLDKDGNPKGREHEIFGGHFSSSCKYSVTPFSSHGPVPWDIFNTKGKKIRSVGLNEAGDEVDSYFLAWSPTIDELYLASASSIQVYSVNQRHPLKTFAENEVVTWSSDGKSLWVARGTALRKVTVQ